jgi:hypothetical protein
MGELFISIAEKESQKPTHTIECPSSSGFEDDGHLLSLCMGALRERYDYEYNRGRKNYIYLGTLPSYFWLKNTETWAR